MGTHQRDRRPVSARQLLAIGARDGLVECTDASLVGRHWEMAAVDAMVDRAIGGRGGIVNVVGPPGIGKSRVAREVAALAADRGVEVFWALCESHAADIPVPCGDATAAGRQRCGRPGGPSRPRSVRTAASRCRPPGSSAAR